MAEVQRGSCLLLMVGLLLVAMASKVNVGLGKVHQRIDSIVIAWQHAYCRWSIVLAWMLLLLHQHEV